MAHKSKAVVFPEPINWSQAERIDGFGALPAEFDAAPAEAQEKREVGFGMDTLARGAKIGGASLRRAIDLAAGGLASVAGQYDAADKIYRESDERWDTAQRTYGFNPETEVPTEGAKFAMALGQFGAQAPLLILGPTGLAGMAASAGVNKATDDLRDGVDPRMAYAQGAIEAGSTLASIAIPASIAGRAMMRVGSGAAANVLQEEAARQASNRLYGDEYANRQREFSIGEAGAAAVIGGGVGGVMGPRSRKQRRAVNDPTATRPPAVNLDGFDLTRGEPIPLQEFIDRRTGVIRGERYYPIGHENATNYVDGFDLPDPRLVERTSYTDMAEGRAPVQDAPRVAVDPLAVMQRAQVEGPSNYVEGMQLDAPRVTPGRPRAVDPDNSMITLVERGFPAARAAAQDPIAAMQDAQVALLRPEPPAPAPAPAAPAPKPVMSPDQQAKIAAGAKPTGSQLERTLAAARAELGAKGPRGKWVAAIMAAKDPIAAMRDAHSKFYGDPKHDAKAELIDYWHEQLTGKKLLDETPQPDPNAPRPTDSTLPLVDTPPPAALTPVTPEGMPRAEAAPAVDVDSAPVERGFPAARAAAQDPIAAMQDAQAALPQPEAPAPVTRAPRAVSEAFMTLDDRASNVINRFNSPDAVAKDRDAIATQIKYLLEHKRITPEQAMRVADLSRNGDYSGARNLLADYAGVPKAERINIETARAKLDEGVARKQIDPRVLEMYDAIAARDPQVAVRYAREVLTTLEGKQNARGVKIEPKLKSMVTDDPMNPPQLGRGEASAKLAKLVEALRKRGRQAENMRVVRATAYGPWETKVERVAAQWIGKVLGTEVIFFEGRTDSDGFHHDGILFINVSVDRPTFYTLGHEFFHAMVDRSPDAYAAFRKTVDTVRGDAVYGKYKAQLDKLYDSKGLNRLDDAATREEFYADVAGLMFVDAGFWGIARKVAGEKFNAMAKFAMQVIERVAPMGEMYLRAVGKSDRAYIASRFVTDADTLHTALATMIRDTADVATLKPDSTRVDSLLRNGRGDEAIGEHVRGNLVQAIGDGVKTIFNANNPLRGFVHLSALADMWKRELPAITKFYNTVEQRAAFVRHRVSEYDAVVQKLKKADDGDSLAWVMHNATLLDVHPDQPLAKQYWVNRETASSKRIKQLFETYNGLTAADKAIYAEVRDALDQSYRRTLDALKDEVNRVEGLDDKDRTTFMKELDALAGKRKGPYFPLSRFGKYIVIGNKEGSESPIVEFHESGIAAALAAAQMRSMGLNVTKTMRNKNNYMAEISGASPLFVQKVVGAIEGNSKLSTQQKEAIKSTIVEAYLKALPDNAGAKRMLSRRGVAGYSNDAVRSVAYALRRAAHYEGTLLHRDEIDASLIELKSQVNAIDGDRVAAAAAEQMVHKHLKKIIGGVDHPLDNALSAFGYAYMLALSPAYYALNATQVPTVALPYIAARYGYMSTMKHMSDAMKEYAQKVPSLLYNKELKSWTLDFDPARFTKDSGEQQMLRAVADAGLLDDTLTKDLAGIAEGDSPLVHAAKKTISFPAHHFELANRVITALSAYRVARERVNINNAIDYAKEAVLYTQGNYHADNRPFYMSGQGGMLTARALWIFQQYRALMGYLLFSQAKKMVDAHETPAERWVAAKTLGGTLALNGMALAGIAGMPAAALLLPLASWLMEATDDEEHLPRDARAELYGWLVEELGYTTATAVMKGIPAALGADASKRAGFGDLLGQYDIRSDAEGRALLGDMLVELIGPHAGLMANGIDSVEYMKEGDTSKAIEMLLPKAVRDILRAVRYGTEGYTNRQGELVLAPAEMSGYSEALGINLIQLFGFAPTEVTNAQAGQRAVSQAERELKDTRNRLYRSLMKAIESGDQDRVLQAQEALLDFARARPEAGVSSSGVKSAFKRRLEQRQIREMTGGVAVHPKKMEQSERYRRFVQPDE